MTRTQVFQARLSETLRLALVYRLSRELNAELSSGDILKRVLHGAAEALGTPFASIAALHNGVLQDVYAIGGHGEGNHIPLMQRVLDDGLAGFVVHNRRTVIVNDISSNPLWMPLPDESYSPQQGSALCVPLVHGDGVVGVLTLSHPAPGYFTSDAVNLTNTISEMGAGALSNALLLEAARRAELRYAHLFDDAIVPIIITDLQGVILNANRRACAFLDYSRDGLLRRTIQDIHRGPDLSLDIERFASLERGQELSFQSMAWTKTGDKHPVQVHAKRISEGQDSDRIQWIEHDLSSQIMLDQLRRDLSAMVYHDMRGPLGNVHTSVETLLKLLVDHSSEAVHSLLEVASRSERQVRSMIDSLLDVQYLEEGSKLLTRSNISLANLISEALDQVDSTAKEKSIDIRTALPTDLPLVYVDAEMIRRVITNLLDNAIKYCSDEGNILISAASNGREVFVRVKDDGPGIPSAAQVSIFDKYSRVKQRNMPHGVGLGLAFCKLAVEAHGGRIWVRSQEDQGSTFTFAVPLDAPATQELPLLGATSMKQTNR